MVYCSKCGHKNEDEAEFCSKCGISLTGKVKAKDGDHCEESCVAGEQSPYKPIFWGLIVIIIGLWIIFEVVIPDSYLPYWLQEFSFWWFIGLIIAIAFIITGIRMMTKKN